MYRLRLFSCRRCHVASPSQRDGEEEPAGNRVKDGALAAVVGFVLLLAMGLFTARNLELATGIAHLLPGSTEQDLARISSGLLDSSVTRTMVLSVSAQDLPSALSAAMRWKGVLANHPEVAAVRSGPGPAFEAGLFDLYFPRRLLLLSGNPEAELGARLSPEGLERAARRLRRELALPQGQLVKEIARRDPLLTFPDQLRNIEELSRGPLKVIDGQFAAPVDRAAILFVTTHHSAFNASLQAPLEGFIERSFADLAQGQSDLRLERSGVHRFAVASEQQARQDMQRITVLSGAGIALLFLLVFGSLWLLAISMLPIVAGVLTATSLGILIFGELNLMTLVFGSTLIGVTIDYPIHYVSHHTLDPAPSGPRASLAHIWGALVMGALTTTVGFLAMTISDLPGIRQIGFFAAVGVLAALAATRLLLPPLLPRAPRVSGLQGVSARQLERLVQGMGRRRPILVFILLLAGAVTAVGLPRMSFRDDVFALGLSPRADWREEDDRVRRRVARMDPGRFVVALGDDEETALRLNDRVYERLVAARNAGEVAEFRSLRVLLPSVSLQERNRATVLRLAAPGALHAALAAEGFRAETFEDLDQGLSEENPEPLRFKDLAASALADAVATFRVDLDDRVALLTFLKGIADASAITSRLADLRNVHYFDQQSFLERVYGRYRERTSLLIAVGMLAVVALLYARYRRLTAALLTAAPALTAAAVTAALLSLAGVQINLLHLLGLLLVLSVGVDYSIFLVSASSRGSSWAAASLSLCAACLSTCLAFGLLALSSFPALRALGSATALGALLSVVLAPSVLLLTHPAGRSR